MPTAPELIVRDSGGVGRAEYTLLQAINFHREDSHRSRFTRRDLNKANWDLVWGRQDWSHKAAHQSREFLPDLPMAFERASAVVERALTDFGDWFSLEGGDGFLEDQTARKLLQHHLDRLWRPGNRVPTQRRFAGAVGDGVKFGFAEATATFKVFGVDTEELRFRLQRPPPDKIPSATYERTRDILQQVTVRSFRLAIDPIPYEDYYPDHSTLNLYDIHEVTRGLHELRANKDYDPEAIERLQSVASNQQEDRERKRRRTGHDRPGGHEQFTVRSREFWGTLLEPTTGKVLEQNKLITTAGDTLFLRGPRPMPFWSGRRPFVTCALLPIPQSTVHKALLDLAGPMARLQNEFTNLMLDSAFKTVHGIGQFDPHIIENADECTEGIPPGFDAVLKQNVPTGRKFYERLDEGGVPQFADFMLRRIERAFQDSMATSSIGMGQLAPRQVKATEIVESLQATSDLFEAIAARIERDLIAPTLELSWQLIWQYLEDFTDEQLVKILGPRRALRLHMMTREQRFVRLAQGFEFKVQGLRSIAARARNFQKLVMLLQTITNSPALAQAYDRKWSTTKLLEQMIRALDIDHTTLEKDQDQRGRPEFDLRLLGAGGNGRVPGGTGGPESQIEAAFAQQNPEGFQGSGAVAA
jgi:hypothetical protein